MKQDIPALRALVDRVVRVALSADRTTDLNAAQMAALTYLSQANRFSRAPAHVAEFLGATRGTVSQTLIALERKGLAIAAPSPADRRSLSYTVTPAGAARVGRAGQIDLAIASLPETTRMALQDGLSALVGAVLEQRGRRSFGMCRTCRHHEPRDTGGAWCSLLKLDLAPDDGSRLCREHASP